MSFQASIISNDRVTETAEAFVSLGSNQPSFAGDEQQTLLAVVAHLQAISTEPVQLSGLYISDPVNCEPGTEDFVNAVARLVVPDSGSPYDLLDRLHKIEDFFGRQRGPEPNAPRSLDLDLISFGASIVANEWLTLPHPRAAQRLFVLVPLLELCSELELGASTSNISDLIRCLPSSPGLKKL